MTDDTEDPAAGGRMTLKYPVRAAVPRQLRSVMADGPLLVAVGRLADGALMNVRLQLREQRDRRLSLQGEQHGELEVIGLPAGPARELKLGEQVELMAGGDPVLTCWVMAT